MFFRATPLLGARFCSTFCYTFFVENTAPTVLRQHSRLPDQRQVWDALGFDRYDLDHYLGALAFERPKVHTEDHSRAVTAEHEHRGQSSFTLRLALL